MELRWAPFVVFTNAIHRSLRPFPNKKLDRTDRVSLSQSPTTILSRFAGKDDELVVSSKDRSLFVWQLPSVDHKDTEVSSPLCSNSQVITVMMFLIAVSTRALGFWPRATKAASLNSGCLTKATSYFPK